MTNPSHFDRLGELLVAYPDVALSPCIADLAANSIDASRFAPDGRRPCRQDVTQYLASWFRDSGFSQDDCQNWLTEYCTEVLAKISSSSKSAIRHSTKSNVKSAYTHCRPFRCEKEANPFKADCMPMCSNYNRVVEEAAPKRPEVAIGMGAAGGVKARYKEQYAKAVEIMTQLNGAGMSIDQIAQQLNDQGFKTKMGKPWKESVVSAELRATQRTPSATVSERQRQGPYGTGGCLGLNGAWRRVS